MVDIALPCTTFMRLQHVAIQPDEWDGKRPWMKCIRFEIRNKQLIALATCGNLIASEFIGLIEADNMEVGITVAPDFLAFVERGIVNDDILIITPVPGWTVARLASGAIYPNNAEWAGMDDWPAWRDLLPVELPKKAMGVMSFSGEHIARIARSAPSGSFTCPKYVDPASPVVVRDVNDVNWAGIFLVNQPNTKDSFEPATIPDWMR